MDLQTVTATAMMHLTGFQEQRFVHRLLSGETGKLCALSPLGNYVILTLPLPMGVKTSSQC